MQVIIESRNANNGLIILRPNTTMQCQNCKEHFHPQLRHNNPESNEDTKLWHRLYYQYCPNCKTFQVYLYEYTNNDKMYPMGTDLENRLKYLGGSHSSNDSRV